MECSLLGEASEGGDYFRQGRLLGYRGIGPGLRGGLLDVIQVERLAVEKISAIAAGPGPENIAMESANKTWTAIRTGRVAPPADR